MDLRTRLFGALLVVPLLAVGIALKSPVPAMAATPCANQTLTGTVKDSIVVTANTTCTLNGATVRGGITIEAGAGLVALNAEIRGAVTGTEVYRVYIAGGVVRGSVTVAGASQELWIESAEVRGNVSLSGAGLYSVLISSTVRSSATLNDNPHIHVGDNTIETDLACANNVTATNGGNPNTVGGIRSGDCEFL